MGDPRRRDRRRGGLRILALAAVFWACACDRTPPDPQLVPDVVLQTELGLTENDRVHTIRVSTADVERADPLQLNVRPGDYVQFVSDDRFVHEVVFPLDSLPPPRRAFLSRTGQSASPPLLELGARFVVSFVGAPVGRYPYRLEGNRGPGGGEIVVAEPER
ncbi:MAG: hypothetical protein R3304_05730 [Longimicrobiales bacterium]|nr:hypothetical protein [Longimicrobiales bacterium]